MRRPSPRLVVALLATASFLGAMAPGPGAGRAAPPPAADPETGALRPPPLPDAHRFGVAHMLPRYRPNGKLGPDILPAGAEDAYRLGFRTIKVGLSREVLLPDWHYYSLPEGALLRVKSIVELARLDAYRRLFDLPFRTYFLAADAIGEGNWDSLRNEPLGPRARENLYRQIHDLSIHLLTTYRDSGKIFILQNHEGDWHALADYDDKLTPTDAALRNSRDYFDLRQKAVDDARREVGATGVYLYHMCEVNLVVKAMNGGKTLTNDLLPLIHPDLVGYSAWDASKGNGEAFPKALAYLRSKANDSFAFGDDNVVISELGVGECHGLEGVGPALSCMLEAIAGGAPWVLQWVLYDNDCYATSGGRRALALDARESDCSGFWVRKPDGSLGAFFRGYQPYLVPANPFDPEPTDPGEYIERLYLAALGRRVEPPARGKAMELLRAMPWARESFVKAILTSGEYKSRTGGSDAAFTFDAYRLLLGRTPERDAAPLLARTFRTDAERLVYLDSFLRGDESRRRFVTWLYRRYLDRDPDPAGLEWGLRALKSRSRQQVHDAFVRGVRSLEAGGRSPG